MRTRNTLLVLTLLGAVLGSSPAVQPIDIGSRLQLMADRTLVDKLGGGTRYDLHRPTPQGIAVVMDKPWEGNAVNYVTVFQDGDLYRLYYRGADVQYSKDDYRETHPEVTCYAESRDGIRWVKPELGLFEFNGSKGNNIVWNGIGTHNFTPFKDTNPGAAPEERYKALGFA